MPRNSHCRRCGTDAAVPSYHSSFRQPSALAEHTLTVMTMLLRSSHTRVASSTRTSQCLPSTAFPVDPQSAAPLRHYFVERRMERSLPMSQGVGSEYPCMAWQTRFCASFARSSWSEGAVCGPNTSDPSTVMLSWARVHSR